MLEIMLEKGFCPRFINIITRPSTDGRKGSCIDNMFIKTKSIDTLTFKLRIPFTHHYPLFLKISKLPKHKRENINYQYNYTKLENMAMCKN